MARGLNGTLWGVCRKAPLLTIVAKETPMLQIIAQGKPFAFIRRQAQRKVLVLSGSVSERERLADIPRGEATAGAARSFTTMKKP